MPSRPTAAWPGPRPGRPARSSSVGRHQLAGLDACAVVEAAATSRQVDAAEPRAERLGDGAAQQVRRAPRPRGPPRRPRTRPCRAASGTTDGRSHDPRHGGVLAGERGAAQRGGRDGLGGGDGEAGGDAGARSTAGDSRTARVKRATTSIRWSGTRRATQRRASCRTSADLVVEPQRVVGADLGTEPVLQRRDDAAAVGVVLGVRAGARAAGRAAAAVCSRAPGCRAPPAR